MVETTREGRRPERTVYQITAEGQEDFETWLTELLQTPSFDLTLLIAACSFLAALTQEAVTQSFNIRLAWLEREMASREAAVRQASSFLPRIFLIEEEYARTMLAPSAIGSSVCSRPSLPARSAGIPRH